MIVEVATDNTALRYSAGVVDDLNSACSVRGCAKSPIDIQGEMSDNLSKLISQCGGQIAM